MTGPDRLRLLIATGPSTTGDLLDHDLDVVRPALIFADEVVLLSPVAWMVFGMAASVSQEDPVARAQVVSSLATAVPGAAVPPELAVVLSGIAETNRLLREGNREQRRALKKRLGKHSADIRQMAATIDDQYEMLQSHVYKTMLEGHPAEELVVAADRSVLTVDGLGLDDGTADFDSAFEVWWDRIRQALVDPHTFLLFDEQVAGLVRAHVQEHGIAIPDLAAHQQRQSGLATGFLTRLPTIDQATVAEILDFKDRMASEVSVYRSATAEMASAIAEPVHSKDFDAVITNRWLNEVQPALMEIQRRAVHEGLARRVLDEASRSGLQLGGLLGGAFAAASVAGWAAAIPPVVAAGTKLTWDVHRAGSAARAELQGHRFILLHEAQEQLGR